MTSSVRFTGTLEEIRFIQENVEAIGSCERLIDVCKLVEKGFGRPVSLDEIKDICYIVSFILSQDGWVPTVYTNQSRQNDDEKDTEEDIEEGDSELDNSIGARITDVKLNKYVVTIEKHGWIVEVAEGEEHLLPDAARTLFQIRAKDIPEDCMEFLKVADDAYPDEDVAMTIGSHRDVSNARGVYLREGNKGGKRDTDSVIEHSEEDSD